MDSVSKVKAGAEVFHLMRLARHQSRLRRAHLGIENNVGEMSGSADLFLAFIEFHENLARSFAKCLNLELDLIKENLLEIGLTKEAVPEKPKNLTEIQKKIREMVKDLDPIFSAPLKYALVAARSQAIKDGKETYGIGDLLAELLSQECEARKVLVSLSSLALLETAIGNLRGLVGEERDHLQDMQRHTKEMLDATWPKILADQKAIFIERFGRDRILEGKEKAYAGNPDLYEQSVDLLERFAIEVPPDKEYAQRLGACLKAGQNEARIRKAPEVKLDHVFFAILQQGTATSGFLASRGIDSQEWRQQLDKQLPRFQQGPRWPPNARDLGMNIPSGGKEILLKEDIPDDLDLSKLTSDERGKYVEVKSNDDKFTDLLWLRAVAREKDTIGWSLLEQAGLTEDLIRAEIRSWKTGDPEWHLKRPNLVKKLRSSKRSLLGISWYQYQACVEASQFEARLRWASSIEFEHILLALLVEGTDTSNLLDSLGVDRDELKAALHSVLPRFVSGPYFPESKDYFSLHCVHIMNRGVSSDLKILEYGFGRPRGIAKPEPSGIKMLRDRGVTLEVVISRLQELGVPFEPDFTPG